MTKPTVDLSLGTWTTPEVPITVEYSLSLMEEIRAAACEGLQQLLHGGLEISGILFGTHSDNLVRVLHWRPIACEHAEGPTIRLSTRDRIALTRQLEVCKSDPDLAGMQPVGWFLSHCRSDIFLTASDLEIFNGFFSEPWQVTIVVRPTRLGPARAGIFVRESGGNLKSDASYLDFNIDPVHRPGPAVERRAVPRRNLPIAPAVRPEPRHSARPETVPAKPVATPQFLPVPRSAAARMHWLWAIPGTLTLLIIAAVAYQRYGPVTYPPFSFRAYNAQDKIQVEWDPASPAILAARQATISITTGGDSKSYSLNAPQLRDGKAAYPWASSDTDIRMILYPARSSAIQAFARLVAPAQTPALSEVDRLKAEVERLKQELSNERRKRKKPPITVGPSS
jgi:hypothetical protein